MSAGIDFPWLRRIRVEFGGASSAAYESDGTQTTPRIAARIEKVIQSLPNATSLTMYNIGENVRNSLKRKETTVTIKAGWDHGPWTGLKKCFEGRMATSYSQRAGPDIVTNITAMSVPEEGNLLTVKCEYKPGEAVRDKVKELASMLGCTVDDARIKGITAKFGEGGWNAHDTVKGLLDRMSHEFGFSWNVTDNIFQSCDDRQDFGSDITIESPYLIDVNPVFSGQMMMQELRGLRIRCTFNPSANVMFGVKVKSTVEPKFNGDRYTIHNVAHNLDCWNASSFITEINAMKTPGAN